MLMPKFAKIRTEGPSHMLHKLNLTDSLVISHRDLLQDLPKEIYKGFTYIIALGFAYEFLQRISL